MRVTSCPNSCKRCFVTIPSAIPVVRAYNSASAELKLTVCCVRDHAVSVAFSTAQLRRMCFCALLLGLSNRCLCTRSRTSEVSRFRPSSLHLERLSSISQYASNSSHHSHMMSVRSWNMYNNFPTTVLYIARLSLSSSASDSVVGVLLTVGVVTEFCFFQTKNSYHISDVHWSRFHRVFSCCLLDHSTQEENILSPSFSIRPMILIKTCFDKSSTNFKTSLLGPNSKPSSTRMKILCSSHRFGSNSDLSRVGGSSDFPGYSQGVGATMFGALR